MSVKTLGLAALLGAALFAAPVAASTLNEADVAGGFSGNWQSTTIVSDPVSTVTGSWSGSNDYDLLTFTSLPTGAQIISIVFEAVLGYGNSYSAGGAVVYKTSPYQYSAWEGTTLGNVSFGNYNVGTPITLTLELGEDFAGFLNLALYGTHPNPLTYNISSPAWATTPDTGAAPSPVPLPAAGWLLLAALSGLGLAGARRARA